ncbi:MAG: hypothetical protein IIY78_10075, partial [Clostridia bacterium]|nr:hypothetical protein [Clostridia bacterium]
TVIVSSHILGELEHTADRFGIVHNGIVAKEITQDDLKSKKPEVNIALSVNDIERAQKVLADNNINILHEVEDRMTLEDYYFDLIGGAAD